MSELMTHEEIETAAREQGERYRRNMPHAADKSVAWVVKMERERLQHLRTCALADRADGRIPWEGKTP